MMIGEITQMYSNLQGYTPLECELALLEYILEWEDYGVSHYLTNVGLLMLSPH